MVWPVFGSSMYAYCTRDGRSPSLAPVHPRLAQEVSALDQTSNLIDLQTREKCDGLILSTPSL
jgi:hypothetical protein